MRLFTFVFPSSFKSYFHSLKIKLMLSIVLVFGLFIAAIIINNIISTSIISNKITQSVVNNTTQADEYLSLLLKKSREIAYNISVELYVRENVRPIFESENTTAVNPYIQYKALSELIDTTMYRTNFHSEINSIFIYNEKLGKLITSSYGVFLRSDLPDYSWFDFIETFNGDSVYKWIGNFYDRDINDSNYRIHNLSLICRADKIKNKTNGRVFVSVNIHEPIVFNTLKNLKITPNTIIYLVDENNLIISAQNKDDIGTYLEKKVGKPMALKNSDIDLSRIKVAKSGYYQSVYRKNALTGWGIVVLVPEKELLHEQTLFWYILLSCLIVITAALMFLAINIIVKYVDKPTAKLVKSMKLAEKGDFNHEIKDIRNDEFGSLYISYNEMVRKIKILIKELYQENLLKREMQLQYLQKQLNPHFLYNTLDTINWLSMSGKTEDIPNVTAALSNLYRTVFNKGSDFIEVAESITQIESYLYIQKFKYGDMIDYSIKVDENANGFLVLNLMLQPIVENALIHSVGNMDCHGLLEISVTLFDNQVCFEVKDNGKGMGSEKLRLLMASLDFKRGSSDSGLKNVHNRIKLFYGENYGVNITSTLKEGTCVKISLPVFEPLP